MYAKGFEYHKFLFVRRKLKIAEVVFYFCAIYIALQRVRLVIKSFD